MSLDLLTPPAVEPLDLATAKLWARIDGDEFDALLPMMISAARQIAEQKTGTKLIEQTWRVTLSDWPAPSDKFALFPVTGLAASYFDGSTWQDLPALQAGAFRSGFSSTVQSLVGGTFSSLGSATGDRVRLDFTCGYGPDGTDVPAAIRQFMAAHIAYWIRSPEAATERYSYVKSPFLDALLDPFTTFL